VTKRLVWFTAGLLSGAVGTVYGYVRLRQSAARPIAERVGGVVSRQARAGVDGVRRLVEDTRDEIRAVESELDPSRGQSLPVGSGDPGPAGRGRASR
jgi:hypothetical protein